MDTPFQLTFDIDLPHHNQYLFSDHYLNNLLPGEPHWSEAMPDAEALLSWLQSLYAKETAQLCHYTETQLEDHWFKLILRKLGHAFERQASVPGLDAGVKRPDYVFFPDESARQVAVTAQKTEDYTAHASALGGVKRWGGSLGKKQKGGGPAFEAQNPSWQINYYVRTTGLVWGILSNGRSWRLIHKDSSHRLSLYYEVDLVELLRRSDAAQLLYFLLFFRHHADRPLFAPRQQPVRLRRHGRQRMGVVQLGVQGISLWCPRRPRTDGRIRASRPSRRVMGQ